MEDAEYSEKTYRSS